MTDHPAIELATTTKTYGERTVLDLDLTVESGETLALLGPNGAGKTTAVEICEGYRRPTSGTVRVLGEEPAEADATWRARLGIVTQETGAFDRLKVSEAVEHLAGFYPDPLGVEEVLDLVDLRGQGDQLVDELSGGQRRRVDLACGLVGRPELLFLDEPTTGLDPEIRRRLWEVIGDLRTSGVTILLTSHYLDEAEALADRIAVIDHGRLVAIDTPPAAYVVGKLGYVLSIATLQTIALIAVGVTVFDADLPDAEGWLTLSWVLVLGLTSAFLLGIAISTLISNPRSASSVVNFPFIVLQFISGIWFIFSDLPTWLQHIASLFPLRWMALGMRAAFLPDSFAAAEPGGSWQLGTVALVLGAWTIAGFAVVISRFRLRTER